MPGPFGCTWMDIFLDPSGLFYSVCMCGCKCVQMYGCMHVCRYISTYIHMPVEAQSGPWCLPQLQSVWFSKVRSLSEPRVHQDQLVPLTSLLQGLLPSASHVLSWQVAAAPTMCLPEFWGATHRSSRLAAMASLTGPPPQPSWVTLYSGLLFTGI